MPIINKTKRTAAIFNRGREVVKVYDHGVLAWQKSTAIPDYLCFTALEAGTFTLTIPAAVTPTYLSYVEWSKDGRTWNHTDNTSEAVTIQVDVAQGEKVYWRGSGIRMGTSASNTATTDSIFTATGDFEVSGNIMSLLYGNLFEGVTSLPIGSEYTFAGLFYNNNKLLSIADLSLPATALVKGCYASTFYGCSNMTGMLSSLPATSYPMAACYMMFRLCSKIDAVPSLKFVSGNGGYQFQYMFDRCTSLVDASAIVLSGSDTYSFSAMFTWCSALAVTPVMSLSTLKTGCFNITFQGCTNLKYVKCLATDIAATNCLYNWLNGVSSTGTFIQAEGVEWPRGASGIPTGWVDIEKRTMPSGYKQVESITPTIGSYFQLTAYAMDNHYSIEIGYRGSSEEIADATYQQQIAGYNLADAANLKQMCGYIYTRQNTGAQVWAQRNAGVYTNPNTGQQSLNSSSLPSTFTLDTNPHTFVYLPDSSAESIKFIIDGTVVQTYGKTYYDAANQNPIPTGAPYKLYKITILRPLQRGTTYYLKGYASDNTTLATDCVPCIRTSDNKVGLYDFVESTFEEGTGTFTAGEEI